MQTIVLADLKAKSGFVNKDTVAGGYGSRFRADSVMTRVAMNLRRIFQNLPSIQIGYLAAIFLKQATRLFTLAVNKSKEIWPLFSVRLSTTKMNVPGRSRRDKMDYALGSLAPPPPTCLSCSMIRGILLFAANPKLLA